MTEISVALKIADFDLKAEDISSIVGLNPTHSFMKGERYYLNTQRGKVEKEYPNSFWEYRVSFKIEDWTQNIIDKFIDEVIVPRQETLKKIADKYYIELFIGIRYRNEANPSYHFKANQLRVLGEIGMELDIDTYV
jgi:hypothetical protein